MPRAARGAAGLERGHVELRRVRRDPREPEGIGGHRGNVLQAIERAPMIVTQPREPRSVRGLEAGDVERQRLEVGVMLGPAG
jgi:hypothetical protein